MSDFTFEQLKSLFENLQDRLDKTAGDKLSLDELEKIRQLLDRQAKEMKKASTTSGSKDTDAFIRKFWDSWKAQQPLKAIQGDSRQPKSSSTGDDGQTFIRRKQQELGNATGDITDSLKQSARSQRNASKKRETALSQFTRNLDKATFRLTSWTSALKSGSLAAVGTGATKKGLGALQTRIDAFRDVINSGGGQIKNMTEMTNVVNQAHMSVTELADALKDQRSGARILGGSSYAQLTGNLTKATNSIGNMGMSFAQRQDVIQDYLEIQQKQGTIRKLSQDQMVSGIESLVKSSKTTATILGQTQKEARDARKAQLADANWATFLNTMGLNPDQKNDLIGTGTIIKNIGGDQAESAFKQLTETGVVTGDNKDFLSKNPEIFKMFQKIADAANSKHPMTQEAVSKMFQDYSKTHDVANERLRAQLGGLGDAGFTAGNAFRINAANLKNGPVDQLNDKGDVAELNAEEAMRTAASAVATSFDTLHNSLKAEFGPEMYAFMQKIIKAGDSLIQFITKLQGYPAIMSTFGVAALAATAGLSAVSGAATVLSLAFKAFKLPGILLNLAKGGGGAAAAEAGVAGAAKSGGGSLISRWLGRAGGAVEGAAESGAGKAVLGTAAAGLKRNALIGSLFESFGYLTGQKDLSLKNLAKSGLRIGGGALGAIGGGLLTAGMGGEFVGGAGGYMAGDKLGDWLLGADDTPQTDAANKKATQGKQTKPNPATKSADATGRQGPGVLTPEQMNQRIMEASERATNILKGLKDNSDKQLEIMREEIVMMRRANDRTHRLLEDGNKNTKAIMDNSV